MPYSAADAVEDAYDATRDLLFPFELRRWLALAVVVFFVSGATGFEANANLGLVDLPTPPGPAPGPGPAMPGYAADLPVVVAVAAVVVLLALALAFVGAVMEFVFVRSLATREVRVREYFGANTSKGLSLFLFRFLLGLVVLAGVVFLAVLVVGAGLAGFLLVALLSPVVLLGFAALYLLHRFTVDFVVPIMLVDDVGVVEGWRRLVPELRAETAEYAVYAVLRLALGFAASVVAGVGFGLVALAVGIPFAVVAAVLAFLEATAGYAVAAPLLFATVAVYAVAVTAVGVVLVQTPVSTYLRYYALFVLGDVSPEYDLLEAIRREGDGDDGRGGAPEEVEDGGGGEGGSPTGGGAIGDDDVEEWPP